MNDNLLEMSGITKYFPGVVALDDVDFSVKKGEIRCLIGANGAGKSTLMKILSGAYSKDAGTIMFDSKEITNPDTRYCRNIGIAVIYQELSLIDSLSVAENIFLNNYQNGTKGGVIEWRTIKAKTVELLKDFNISISPDTLVNTLSIGHRQLIEILKAIAINAKLIVMDEPSSTLSKEEFEALLRIIKVLKNKGMTIIYISHRLEELFMIGDSITVLRDGKHIHTGAIDKVDQNELIRLMIGHNIIPFVKKKLLDEQNSVLKLTDVSTSSIHNINMDIKRSEIRGIYGLVGSGRTEILRAIYGVDKVREGLIYYKEVPINFQDPYDAIRAGIGLLPENRKVQGLVLPHAVWENVALVSLRNFLLKGVLSYKKIYSTTAQYIKKLSIKTPSHHTKASSLSGGNQQKVIIAKWLVKDCEVLLVDEPTQGIDVGAKAEIYQILEDLADQGKTILIVSSELDELLAVSNKISVMYEGCLVKTFGSEEFDVDSIQTCALTGRID